MGANGFQEVAKQGSGLPLKLLPFHPDPRPSIVGGREVHAVFAALSEHLAGLDLDWSLGADEQSGVAMSRRGDVWSRAYRRAKQRGSVVDADEGEGVKLGVKVRVVDGCLEMVWVQGLDEGLFQSFYTMVTRTIYNLKVNE